MNTPDEATPTHHDERVREKCKEIYLSMWGHGPAINGADVDILVKALRDARNEALEEAANVAYDKGHDDPEEGYFAEPWVAIRALKSKENSK